MSSEKISKSSSFFMLGGYKVESLPRIVPHVSLFTDALWPQLYTYLLLLYATIAPKSSMSSRPLLIVYSASLVAFFYSKYKRLGILIHQELITLTNPK